MELEEMQATWAQMSKQLENQKKLTDKLIIGMTQQKFRNRFSTLATFESMGALVCFIAASYILFNIDKLHTWYLLGCAAVSLVFLIGLPIITLRSLFSLKNMNLQKNTLKETLIAYTKKKKNLLLIQKVGAAISVLIMWAVAPVFGTITSGDDFFKEDYSFSMLLFFGLVTIMVILFAGWGFRCYKRITASAEKIIRELEDTSV